MIVRADGEIEVIATWFYAWKDDRIVAIHTYEDEYDRSEYVEEFDDLKSLADDVVSSANAYVEEGAEVEIRVVGDHELYEILKAKARV